MLLSAPYRPMDGCEIERMPQGAMVKQAYHGQ